MSGCMCVCLCVSKRERKEDGESMYEICVFYLSEFFKDVELNLKEFRNINIRILTWFIIDIFIGLFYFLCYYGCVKDISYFYQ